MRRLMAGPVVLVLLVALAACVTGTSPAATPHDSPSPMASVVAPTEATTPPPPETSPAETSLEPSPALPPDALLVLPDGSLHTGTLGSFVLGDHGTDAPWLPAFSLPPVTVRAGTELTARFADATPIGFWQAIYAAADDTSAKVTRGLGEREADSPPLDEVAFRAPPPGAWVVSVRLRFADGGGDAAYFWHLVVT